MFSLSRSPSASDQTGDWCEARVRCEPRYERQWDHGGWKDHSDVQKARGSSTVTGQEPIGLAKRPRHW